MEKTRLGRPPKYGDALMTPITIRLPAPMMVAIESIQAGRMDAPDKSGVIRELLAEAIGQRVKRKIEQEARS
jgi:hypothetical protein